MSTTFVLTIDSRKLEDFYSDWEHIGPPLRKKCTVTEKDLDESHIQVTITVTDKTLTEIFKSAVFGAKGCLTQLGWKTD